VTERPPAPPVRIRAAGPSDRDALAECEDALARSGNGSFAHRLDIPHGEDYFCVVAVCAGTILGYCSAGGSRDDDRKSFGEIYDLGIPAPGGDGARPDVAALLLDAVLEVCRDARYGGVIAWVPPSDASVGAALEASGFAPGPPVTTSASGARRWECVFASPVVRSDTQQVHAR
jgi:hypothetical protein